jgi:hypothetical protein
MTALAFNLRREQRRQSIQFASFYKYFSLTIRAVDSELFGGQYLVIVTSGDQCGN